MKLRVLILILVTLFQGVLCQFIKDDYINYDCNELYIKKEWIDNVLSNIKDCFDIFDIFDTVNLLRKEISQQIYQRCITSFN